MLQNSLLRINFGQRAPMFALALSCLAFTGGAKAAILTPGPGAFGPDVFTLAGLTFKASTGLTPFMASGGKVTGTYIAGVFADPTNAFCAGCLDFVYQINVDRTSPDAVGRATAIDFTGWMTDVGYTATGSSIGGPWVNGTVIPQTVDRPVPGDRVGFTYSAPLTNQIGPASAGGTGLTSVVMVIETNATNWTGGTLNIIDGGVTPVAAFQPLQAVPEPASFGMIGAGLLALAGIRRMRRK